MSSILRPETPLDFFSNLDNRSKEPRGGNTSDRHHSPENEPSNSLSRDLDARSGLPISRDQKGNRVEDLRQQKQPSARSSSLQQSHHHVILSPGAQLVVSSIPELSTLIKPLPNSPASAIPFVATDVQPSRYGNRERVMGLRTDPVRSSGRAFVLPKLADVLPLSSEKLFSAWHIPQDKKSGGKWRLLSVGREGQSKKVWEDRDLGVYRVGWEREVLDLESRLHETMYDLTGRHTFAEFEQEPKAVLDVGTGIGLWPISQALLWPLSRIIGLDLVPIQVDLQILAAAERRLRPNTQGTMQERGKWGDLSRRITWDKANCLLTLPYDSSSFDLVHIRFLNLAVPECSWQELIAESIRVLKPRGKLEIVETSYLLSSDTPEALRDAFSDLLRRDKIQPVPLLPIRFNLPLLPGLKEGATKPAFEKRWSHGGAGALRDALEVWTRSALGYEGAAGRRKDASCSQGVVRELRGMDPNRWEMAAGVPSSEAEGDEEQDVTVWAWVVEKR